MQRSIQVRILGREYPLRIHEEDEVSIRTVAAYVDERMRTFKNSHPGQPDLVAAVMCALGLAEELRAAHETANVLLSSLDREVDLLKRELADQAQALTEPSKGAVVRTRHSGHLQWSGM